MRLNKLMDSLKKSDILTSYLANGAKSIYRVKSPSKGTYPVIVLTVLSNVPALSADDKEVESRQTVRAHILTKDGKDATQILRVLTHLMTANGYRRRQTYEGTEDGVHYIASDYIRVYETEE